MTQATINEIIALEKELQARIKAEEEKIGQWLAAEEAGIGEELALGLAAWDRRRGEEEERVRRRVEAEAAAILATAERECARCLQLSQAKLEDHARRHLRKILPG